MIQFIVYLCMLISFIGILASPWVPALFYFLNGIMQPSYVWPWTFPEFSFMSLSKILAITAILGWMKLAITQKIDWNIYKRLQNFVILLMWALMHISDLLSPYPYYFAGVRGDLILSVMNTIVIMYFIGLGVLSNVDTYKKSFFWFSIMFGFIALYYAYWANDMYLSDRWDMFQNGRLVSPPGTPIGDQNALSGLVAMGMPFIFLGYFYIKKKLLKWSCLAVLPLLWHSLFLFGSRGAMIALLCSTVLCLYLLKPNKQKKNINTHKNQSPEPKDLKTKEEKLREQETRFKSVKLIKIFMVIGLAGAIISQGGAMLNRSTNTISSAQSESEAPLNPRLISWEVGKQLIMRYPLLGAGPQRFQMASHELFPGKSIHVAHNTFINFSANTGLPVGLLFLSLFWFSYKNYRYCKSNGVEQYPLLEYVNIACTASLSAFFITAIFLDLIIFEAFYFILMFNLAKLFVFEKLISQKENKDVQNINTRSQKYPKRT